MAKTSDITAMLQDVSACGGAEIDRLMPAVYEELRRLAERHLRNERRNHTLQPTALANEAYLKLVRQESVHWRDRMHFFGAAGQAIRRILVDHARGRNRQKRAGQRVSLALDHLAIQPNRENWDFVALDEALSRLAVDAPRKARVVELRFLSGLTAENTAAILGVTVRTVERDWRYARAWLFRELERDDKHS